MNEGYIYVLINSSFHGLIKIGSTTLSAEKRARQLSASTGVPTPFTVAYEIYVGNCKDLEKHLHEKLDHFRINSNREFFNYPLNEAIKMIQHLANTGSYVRNDKFQSIDITDKIRIRYRQSIDPTISSLKICQDEERVYFELTKDKYIAGYLKDQHITRTDLAFIIEDIEKEEKLFRPECPIEVNVRKFLELDDISMANCVGEIFTDDWQPMGS